jgi:hypothetical protein
LSSILRALKKLENEPRHLEENQPLDSKFVTLADTGPQRSFSSILMMVLGGGFVCGLVILAGWWFFSQESQPPPAVTTAISRSNIKLNESSTPSQDFNKTQGKAVSQKFEKSSMEAPAIPETVEQISRQEPAGSEESALQVIDKEGASSAVIHIPEETTLEAPGPNASGEVLQPAAKPVVASISIPATPPRTVEVEIPKLNDRDMKLQAITWSRVPQKRIAVINNRILREGETVSGYLIKTINQDDIVLSLDGEKWKLLFR